MPNRKEIVRNYGSRSEGQLVTVQTGGGARGIEEKDEEMLKPIKKSKGKREKRKMEDSFVKMFLGMVLIFGVSLGILGLVFCVGSGG